MRKSAVVAAIVAVVAAARRTARAQTSPTPAPITRSGPAQFFDGLVNDTTGASRSCIALSSARRPDPARPATPSRGSP